MIFNNQWFAGRTREEINFGPHTNEKIAALYYLEHFFDGHAELHLITHSDGHIHVAVIETLTVNKRFSAVRKIDIMVFWRTTERGVETWYEYNISRIKDGLEVKTESLWHIGKLDLEGKL